MPLLQGLEVALPLQFPGRNLPSDTHQGPGWAPPPVNSPTNENDISTPLVLALSSCNIPGLLSWGHLIKGLIVLLPIVIFGAEYYISAMKKKSIFVFVPGAYSNVAHTADCRHSVLEGIPHLQFLRTPCIWQEVIADGFHDNFDWIHLSNW